MNGFDYDIGIVGGGLAGLTAAIQLKQKGYNVAVWEKNKYPFHRVCGEYISMESWNYLQSCGIPLSTLALPRIHKLEVSAANGSLLKTQLDMGGFGISRYWLDYLLYKQAIKIGVHIFENCKVTQLEANDGHFNITAGSEFFKLRLALGGFGKRSYLDVKWKRAFTLQKPNKLNNYIGVKYHIKTNIPNDTIALHNFKNGYCGVSKIEDNKYCLCYLSSASNLMESGSIEQMEKKVLYQNPYLQKIFEQSEFLLERPVTISQISFNKKEIIHNGVPLMGDACGVISPLCGNGMSMAMHSAKLLTDEAHYFLQHQITFGRMMQQYETAWLKQFSKRLRMGRMIQSNFGKDWQTCIFISILKKLPWLSNYLIKATHGKPFAD